MKNLFKGFDQLTPDEKLKDKTIRKILAQPAAAKPYHTKMKKAIAACLAFVLVGSGVFASILNGSLSKKGMLNSAPLSGTTDKSETYYGETTEEMATEIGEAPALLTDGDADIEYTAGDAPTDETATPETDTAATKGEATGGALKSPTAGTSTKPGSTGSSTTSQSNQATAGLLTAKAWNDNLNFDFWLNLMGQNNEFRQYQANWGINLTKRIAVTVQSGQNVIGGASVSLLDAQDNEIWSAVSDNKGIAYLFYHVFQQNGSPKKIVVKYAGQTAEQPLGDSVAADYTITLDNVTKLSTALDLMFVCDTTGSMGDELSYLQQELADIILRVKKQNGNIPLRLSVNFYRDTGDEYVVRPFPFVSDVNTAINNLKAQSADGGGDFEEAVEQALNDAIYKHDWSSTASAKLLFLILDAPPHDSAKAEMQKLLTAAAQNGIRIIPVTASGIDKNTEYLMRALSTGTGGTYVTLTDDSGIGGSHIEPTIGESKVYKLNDLLVNIINDYLA
ncbi:MAG: VWA domain-containing protein [Clostridiales bacterium]|nr:VWA domain-containing protein [Clostridiales bacterium]